RVALAGFVGNLTQCRWLEFQLSTFHLEELLVLAYQCITGLRENAHQRIFVQWIERRDYWQSADEFRNHAKLDQVITGYFCEQLAEVGFATLGIAAETDRLAADPPRNRVIQPNKRTTADKEDITRIDLDVLLLGMLASSLGRHVADGTFQHL